MSNIDTVLKFNKQFYEDKGYEQYITDKIPNKKLAIVSCMDTRLTKLLPAALNLSNGDVKLIKNAGGVISHPFGSVMRSLIVAIYELGVNEIMVITHEECGMQNLTSDNILEKIMNRGLSQESLDIIKTCAIDIDKWIHGFDSPDESAIESVKLIRNHPLIFDDVTIRGFVINPKTGLLKEVEV